MRCDVCHTKIPLGENVCPNCGMVINKKAGTTHVHTEGNHCEDIHSEAKETDIFTKTSVSADKKFRAISFTIPIISIIIIMIFAANIFVNMNIIGNLFKEHSQTTNQIIGNIEDQYQKMLDWKIEDFKSLGLKVDKNSDMTYYSDTNQYDINIYASKDNLEYTIYYTYDGIDVTSVSLEITGQCEKNENRSLTYLDEDFINELGEYLGFEDTYALFKNGHSNMINHEENPGDKYYIGYSDNYEIYVKENNGEDFDQTLFTYSICK